MADNSPNNLLDMLRRPAQMVLERGVERSTTAASLCERLEGRRFAIRTGTASLNAYFEVRDGKLMIQPGLCDDADASITGSPLNLGRLFRDDAEAVIREGRVSISGDADIATDFRTLLELVQPDLEEELSRFTGDAVAFEAGRAVRGFAGWAQRTRQSLGRSLAEYLTEESRDLVAETEVAEFCRDVDETVAAVDRFEAKLTLFRDQQSAG